MSIPKQSDFFGIPVFVSEYVDNVYLIAKNIEQIDAISASLNVENENAKLRAKLDARDKFLKRAIEIARWRGEAIPIEAFESSRIRRENFELDNMEKELSK